jgi:integrase
VQSSESGLLAEVFLQVNESVEGYRIGSNLYPYRDLRQSNPRMLRKQREFRTTGVVLKISEDWFVTPHTLRHTCATWLMQAGVPKWEAAGFLAMSMDTLERVYGHHHPDHYSEAANAFSRRPRNVRATGAK